MKFKNTIVLEYGISSITFYQPFVVTIKVSTAIAGEGNRGSAGPVAEEHGLTLSVVESGPQY